MPCEILPAGSKAGWRSQRSNCSRKTKQRLMPASERACGARDAARARTHVRADVTRAEEEARAEVLGRDDAIVDERAVDAREQEVLGHLRAERAQPDDEHARVAHAPLRVDAPEPDLPVVLLDLRVREGGGGGRHRPRCYARRSGA